MRLMYWAKFDGSIELANVGSKFELEIYDPTNPHYKGPKADHRTRLSLA